MRRESFLAWNGCIFRLASGFIKFQAPGGGVQTHVCLGRIPFAVFEQEGGGRLTSGSSLWSVCPRLSTRLGKCWIFVLCWFCCQI